MVTTLVSLLMQKSAHRGNAEMEAARSATVSLSGLTQVIEELGIESEGLQAAVVAFAERDPVLAVARVVRFQGIRLMASNAPSDVGDNEAPRKMARDEKALYDLGQSLRAAVETNVSEGRAWKQEIDITPRDEAGSPSPCPSRKTARSPGHADRDDAGRRRAGDLVAAAVLALVIPLGLGALVAPPLRGEPLWAFVAAALLVAQASGSREASRELTGRRRKATESAIAERLGR